MTRPRAPRAWKLVASRSPKKPSVQSAVHGGDDDVARLDLLGRDVQHPVVARLQQHRDRGAAQMGAGCRSAACTASSGRRGPSPRGRWPTPKRDELVDGGAVGALDVAFDDAQLIQYSWFVLRSAALGLQRGVEPRVHAAGVAFVNHGGAPRRSGRRPRCSAWCRRSSGRSAGRCRAPRRSSRRRTARSSTGITFGQQVDARLVIDAGVEEDVVRAGALRAAASSSPAPGRGKRPQW